ncbi:Purple acid phosphatase 15 [Sesamum angolense]|uniref:Purple acid phosphatase n=1 Tax=Sesamum angolense TaxID=2727404 RepID=A0AAE1X2M9_9LAMI|nr:Purple acid phosphatase 15 [Sesamum angolense]
MALHLRKIVVGVFVMRILDLFQVYGGIPTTLEGPFKPVTVPLDGSFRGNAIDLPDSDPRVQRKVSGFEPEQISVSLSYNYDSVWILGLQVMEVTFLNFCSNHGEFQIGKSIKPRNPQSVASVVHYGKLRFPMSHKATGESLIYSQLYPFEGLRNYTSGIIHHVRLTALEPNTIYHYRCGDPSIPAMSEIYYFKTMPISTPKSYPSRIAVVGDLGLTYNSTSTIEHLTSNKPDLVLMIGDLCYANLYLTNGTGSDCYSCSFPDTPIHETYQPRWDYWGRFMQPLISKVPIMMVQGNHEIEEQAQNRTFASYSSRFAFPSKESGSSSAFYYSFNTGGIHFIVLGGYVAYNKSDDQYKWLQKDLAKVNREVTPWLIATWHPPGIPLTGHTTGKLNVHAYERSNRVYNYTLDPCGPVHIAIGDGGNREKMAITHADDPGNCPEPSTTPDEFMGGFCAYNFTSGSAAGKFCWDRQPEYSAYRETSFGHGILQVKNETHALWTWHRNQDMYNKAGDQIYIVRQPERCLVRLKNEGKKHVSVYNIFILQG